MRIPLVQSTLRPWQQGDQAALVCYADNIKLWNNMRDSFPHPYTAVDADFWISLNEKQQEENPYFYQNFALDIAGESVGGIGVLPDKDTHRLNAELGYWLGEPFWGQGIMVEAVQAMVTYAFDQGDFRRLYANVYEYNRPSMRVLEKAGFHLEVVCPKCIIKNEQVIDNYVFGIYRSY